MPLEPFMRDSCRRDLCIPVSGKCVLSFQPNIRLIKEAAVLYCAVKLKTLSQGDIPLLFIITLHFRYFSIHDAARSSRMH